MKYNKSLFILPVLIAMFLFAACSPVNWLTRVKKVPRNYSVNYSHGNVKSKRSELNSKAWVVYSDRQGNAATIRPGGTLTHTELEYMEPMLVIGSKGDYYKLIKYDPAILKDEKLSNRKDAKYSGWIHKERLLLFNNSETEVRNDIKFKSLTSITACRVMLNAEKYFNNDSLLLYSSPRLEKSCGSTALGSIVYVLKRTADGSRVLIAHKTPIIPDEAQEMVSGWVDASLIAPFGQRLALSSPPDVEVSGTLPDTTAGEYATVSPVSVSPALYSHKDDSALVLRTLNAKEMTDYSGNRIYNVDGDPITYEQGKHITASLCNINVIFAYIPTENVVKHLPVLSNAVQNLKSVFDASPKMFNYSYGAVVGKKCVPFTADYLAFSDQVTEAGKNIEPVGVESFLPVVQEALALASTKPGTTNIIVLVGEKAPRPGSIPKYVLTEFPRHNCRLLSYQVYTGAEDVHNNFVLHSLNIIESYAEALRLQKRKVIILPAQLRRKTEFMEGSKNAYALDFPERSITQGMVVFPEKKRFADTELLINSMDSLTRQVESDNLTLINSINRAFAQVGHHHSRFSKDVATCMGIDPQTSAKQYTGGAFNELSLRQVDVTDRISLPIDSAGMSTVGLLLTGAELEGIKLLVEELASMKPDIVGEIPSDDIRFRDVRRVRRDLQGVAPDTRFEHEPDRQTLFADSTIEIEYAPTGKIRRHIKRTYLKALRRCVVDGCRNCLTLARAQEYITTMPTVSAELNSITINDLTKKSRVTDRELDLLIRYFEEHKPLIEEMVVPVEDLSGTEGEKLFFLPSQAMP